MVSLFFIQYLSHSSLYLFLVYSARRPWYPKFRAALNHCETLEEIATLLQRKVIRWRGGAGARAYYEDDDDYTDNSVADKNDEIDDLSLIR